jgi:acyl-CoA synthetase (AMP-forming)/AMP-acid ligase II
MTASDAAPLDTLDDTNVFLPHVWAAHARFTPTKLAMVCGARRVTWAELNAGMNRVANALLRAGIGKGDRVAVVMTNSVEMLEVMFGIVKAGACVVPLSALLTPDQLAGLITDSEACALFANQATHALLAPVADGLTGVRADARIAIGFVAPGWVSFETFTGGAARDEPAVRYALDDDFNIIYSSGTTGLPKGIVQTHRARQHWSYSNAIEMRFHADAVALATTSLYSNGTWFMVLPPMFVGATMVVMESFTPAAALDLIARERVTHVFMVPTQYIVTLDDPAMATADLSSLEMTLSAGSPLRQSTRADVEARFCANLYELYGFSEGFATLLKPRDARLKPGTVGKPLIGFDLRILDDAGRELGPDQPGEIAGFGGGLMKGYHRKPEQTAALIWRDGLGRSFIRSGDIGKLDADGFLTILDRKKDMILSGGFNVFPADIEEIVGQHPDVQDVTVIGIPHDKWGETPLALVIAKPGTTPDAAAMRDWANGRLAKTQRLAAVEFRTEFPRNALGKVLKRVLRDPYWQESPQP